MHTDLMMAILSSLPRSTLPAVQGVCKCWYFTIRNEPFVGIRRQMCSAPMVLAIGGRADAPQGNGLNHGRVSMLLDSKTWVQAPPVPGAFIVAAHWLGFVVVSAALWLLVGR